MTPMPTTLLIALPAGLTNAQKELLTKLARNGFAHLEMSSERRMAWKLKEAGYLTESPDGGASAYLMRWALSTLVYLTKSFRSKYLAYRELSEFETANVPLYDASEIRQRWRDYALARCQGSMLQWLVEVSFAVKERPLAQSYLSAALVEELGRVDKAEWYSRVWRRAMAAMGYTEIYDAT